MMPLLLCGLCFFALLARVASTDSRGVAPVPSAGFELERVWNFDRSESAGIFVGVREFTHDDQRAEVPFAVDDAIDLAHLFAIELELVLPARVRLLLSGQAAKPASEKRLAALTKAGTQVHPATQSDICRWLGMQARAAGPQGLLIASFASHGFSTGGTHHLMAADSLLDIRETAVVADRFFDMANLSEAARQLIFLDTCRERLNRVRGGTNPDPRSMMKQELAAAIGRAKGQVIFSAAEIGGYAYDNYERSNGVFTGAVIDGLRCKAETDRRGFVTVGKLATHIKRAVREWAGRELSLRRGSLPGIQFSLGDPSAAEMPLAFCRVCLPIESQPYSLRVEGDFVEVFSQAGQLRWAKKFSGRIAKAEVSDLNGDCANEVVVGVKTEGADAGRVMVFDFESEALWIVEAPSQYIWQGGHGAVMSVVTFEIADLFLDGAREVVVLYMDDQNWYPARLAILGPAGKLLGEYWHPGHLHHLRIAAARTGENPTIFVAGYNNDLQRFVPGEKFRVGVVFALDPSDLTGEAPPYFGSIGTGSHLWYGVLLPKGSTIHQVRVQDLDGDGENELMVWTNTAHILYLTFDGGLRARSAGDGAQGPAVRLGLVKPRSMEELLAPEGASKTENGDS